jgi:hypothetical protein
MQEEHKPEEQREDEEVEAHKRSVVQEPGIRARDEEGEDEVEAHRMFNASPEEPGKRF